MGLSLSLSLEGEWVKGCVLEMLGCLDCVVSSAVADLFSFFFSFFGVAVAVAR